jgi:predicted lipoprotein with Yx(FWY)xxD motif
MTARHPHPLRTATLGVAGLATAGLLVAGCGSSSSYSGASTTPTTRSGASAAASSGAVELTTGSVAGLGTVLENGNGRVLYVYTPDGTSGVTCTSGCASVWPPLKPSAGQATMASGTAQAALLGTLADPAGGRVVTYAGRPLYTYAGDTSAGTANGQGSGGTWYVVTPAGTPKNAS